MEFYEEIARQKKANKLNNSQLGNVIGISADAFRMALTRGSLTDLQIKELRNYFEDIVKSEQKANKENDLIKAVSEQLLAYEPFIEGIKKIKKEISTQELRMEIENMIKEAEKDTVKNK